MRAGRVLEWVKSLLIVGLSLSAVYLFTLSPLYLNSPLRDWNGPPFQPGEGNSSAPVSLTAAARPARMAVTNDAGRCGLQYDSAGVDALFEQTGSLLGEALGSAGAPVDVTERRWRQALEENGIFFDFAGTVPFSALSRWMGENSSSLTGDVRRLVLAPGDDGAVWLYYQDGWDPQVFRGCATALSAQSHLAPLVDNFAPNGSKFAFEEASLSDCYPYTLITGGTNSAAVYTVSSPLAAGGEAVDQALSALSFSGALVTNYTADNGTVYRAGEESLLLGRDSSLTYFGPEGELYPVASEGETPTLAEMIETTRQLVSGAIEALCGDARLYLISACQEGEETVITYGYTLNGAVVWTGSEGWAAQFRLSGGALTGFTMIPRCYTAAGGSTPLLPAVQAAAAMAAKGAAGRELLLVYRDIGGDTVSAGWAAAQG